MIIVSFKAFQLWLMEAPLPWLFAHWKGQGFWRCHSIFFAKVRKNPLIPVSALNADRVLFQSSRPSFRLASAIRTILGLNLAKTFTKSCWAAITVSMFL